MDFFCIANCRCLFVTLIFLSLAGVSNSIRNATIFHVPDDSFWQTSGHGNRINPLCESADTLPFADPTVLRTHHRNDAKM